MSKVQNFFSNKSFNEDEQPNKKRSFEELNELNVIRTSTPQEENRPSQEQQLNSINEIKQLQQKQSEQQEVAIQTMKEIKQSIQESHENIIQQNLKQSPNFQDLKVYQEIKNKEIVETLEDFNAGLQLCLQDKDLILNFLGRFKENVNNRFNERQDNLKDIQNTVQHNKETLDLLKEDLQAKDQKISELQQKLENQKKIKKDLKFNAINLLVINRKNLTQNEQTGDYLQDLTELRNYMQKLLTNWDEEYDEYGELIKKEVVLYVRDQQVIKHELERMSNIIQRLETKRDSLEKNMLEIDQINKKLIEEFESVKIYEKDSESKEDLSQEENQQVLQDINFFVSMKKKAKRNNMDVFINKLDIEGSLNMI